MKNEKKPIQVLPKKSKKKVKKKKPTIAWIRNTRSLAQICEEDNYLMNQVMTGRISKSEYARKKERLHAEWDEVQRRGY
jgi:spermidine/putrescine-binding protein